MTSFHSRSREEMKALAAELMAHIYEMGEAASCGK